MSSRMIDFAVLTVLSLAVAACSDDSAGVAAERDTGANDSDASSDVGSGGDGGLLDGLLPDLLGGRDRGTADNGDSGGSTGEGPRDGLYTSRVTEVVVEIDYQSGAEPLTSSVLGFGDPFDLFVTNAEAAFAESPRTITVPTTLNEMEELDDVAGDEFRRADILAIADEHRDDANSDARRTFYVLFLDGYYADNSGRRNSVLGVSIGNTGVIAMFKPVIGNGPLAAQIEQTTLVHEFGHAIGMVNNGVPLTSEHQDSEHGAHCTNRDCVMYWAVEGTDITGFVTQNVLSSSTVLWGVECLDDMEAAAD